MELVLEGSLCCIKFGENVDWLLRWKWTEALDKWIPERRGPSQLPVSWKVNKSQPGRLHGITDTGIHIVGANKMVRLTHWRSLQRVDVRVAVREPPSLLITPLDRV